MRLAVIRPMRRAARCLTLAGIALAAACSREKSDRGTAEAAVMLRDTAREPYRIAAVAPSNRVSGVVELRADAPVPPDTLIALGVPAACGTVRYPLVVRDGRRLGEVVVWLDDVREGKALPNARRYELSNERCQLLPRVQGALTDGMLNLKSADAIPHRTSLLLDGDSVALIDHPDAGSIVPVERALARPGLLTASSATLPWMRAWIQVFDHPYFAVTARDGRWSLDSVPAGSWRLVAWHPRYGRKDTTVVVPSATEIRLEF
jgi:hypothetical protein